MFISSLQQLATQLTDLGQTITEQHLISKIICGLPSSFDLFHLDVNVALGSQTLIGSLQSRVIKFQNKLRDRAQELEAHSEKVFFTKGAPSDTSRSHASSIVEQKKKRDEKIA